MFRFTHFSKKVKLIFTIGLFVFGAMSVDTANAQSPCTPSANQNGRCCGANSPIGLGTVTFGSSISNTNSYNASKNYYDFTNISACVTAGSSYSMQVNAAGNNYDHAICVWIDWNADGTFASSEIVLKDSFVNAGGNASGNVKVPSSQSSGIYRMRVMGDYYAYYAFSNPPQYNPCQGYYSEYQDYTIKVAATSGIDVTAVSISSPSSNSVPLNQNFDIDIIAGNLAGTTIDTVEVGYQIDNNSATTKTITGLALASCANTSALNITTTAQITTAGSHTLRVWVNKPNGVNPDDNPNNDTITSFICTSLAGNFTIDAGSSASNSNFVDFTSAVDKINKCGISGAVKFTVASGTYTEQIAIGAVNGASSTNTITFDGVDASTRTITSSSSGVTFKFDGASYVTVKNLTIENTASSNAMAVQLMNVSENNSFDSCIVKITSNNYPNIAFGGCDATYYNTGDFANNTTIDNSEISGGYMTVVFSGDYNKSNYSNKFKNTYIHGGAYYGVYFMYQDSALFQNCEITANNGYPMMWQNVKLADVLNNEIHGGYYAFYSYNLKECNIINNEMYNSQYATFYAYYGTTVNFFHNSIYNDYSSNPMAMYLYSGSGWDVRNNIFATGSNSGYAFYCNTANVLTSCDYNVYFTGMSSNYVYIGSAFSNLASLTGNPNGMNSNIFATAPSFLSMSSPVDLHISSASASPRGDGSVGVTIDIDGDARCAFAPTIGCDESKYASSAIKAAFTMPDTAYINSPVTCLNGTGAKAPAAHQWFDDCSVNASPVASSRNFTNSWSSTGTFLVKLVTQSCSGYDTLCKTIVIVNPTKAPNVDFISNSNTVEQEGQVDFTDLTTDGPTAWTWDISGGFNQGSGVDFDYTGTDSTFQNPMVIFHSPGYYDVCLTSSNSIGNNKVCKTIYIEVLKVEMMCNTAVSHEAHAKFYDDGGKSGNYNSGSQKCTMVIDPCASQVTLSFKNFNVDGTYGANLKIWDGKDKATGKAFHSGNGFTNNPGTLVAKSGKIFVEWTPTPYSWNVASGWEAEWTSVAKSFAKPSAKYSSNDTFYENAPGSFYAKVKDPDATYFWDLDGSGTDAGNGGPSVTGYSYVVAGTYTACCYITSCGGMDTFCKNITVLTPTTAPAADFYTDISTNVSACQTTNTTSLTVIVGDTVTLLDASNYGATSWDWSTSNSSNVTWAGSSANTDQNPQIIFTAVGSYDITLAATNGIGTNSITKTAYIKVINPYCIPSVSKISSDIAIANVTVGAINNTSAVGQDEYTDFTSKNGTCMAKGGKYPFTVSRKTTVNAANINLWVDLNGDGDFDDQGELVSTRSASNNMSFSDSIKIPTSAQLGQSRLRVSITYNNQTNKTCGPNYFGEYEDYGVFITNDNNPPVITLVGTSVTVQQCDTFNDPGATAWDDVDGSVSVTYAGSINTSNLGKQTITYSAQDKAGNQAIKVVREVNVVASTTGPIITLNGANPLNWTVNTNYTDPGANAVSTCGNNVNNTLTSNNNVNTSVIGVYYVNYKATDANGMIGTAVRKVIVGDFTAPVITLNADAVGNTDPIYVDVFSTFTDPDANATDNYYAASSLTKSVTGSVNTSVVGSYVVTYTFTDGSGNIGTKTRTVNVVDKAAPSVTLVLGTAINVEADLTASYTDPGYYAADNYWASSKVNIVVTGGPVDRTKVGTTFTLTYTATDGSGNVGTATRAVTIVKTTIPVLSLVGNAIEKVACNSNWTDPGVIYSDNFYSFAQLTPGFTKTGAVNTAQGGVQTIKYKVCDPVANCAEVTRYVVVDCTTGIADVENSTFSIYPNPSNGIIKISLASTNTFSTIKIYGIGGNLVTEIRGVVKNGDEIDLSELSAGMYQVNLINSNTSIVKPIIITK